MFRPLLTNRQAAHNCIKQPLNVSHVAGKKKGKAISLQAWRGPEGSRRLPDFKTIGT